MRSLEFIKCIALVSTVLVIGGCYSIRKWDIEEARKEKASQYQVPAGDPSAMRNSIAVDLVVPEHLGCVIVRSGEAEKAAGHKMGVCRMRPIAGFDPKAEWKQLYTAETGKKNKAGHIAMNVGPVLRDELERSLRRHYRDVTVNLASAPGASTAVTHDLAMYPAGPKMVFVSNLGQGGTVGSGTGDAKLGAHIAWLIPSMIVTFPLFVWIPLLGSEAIARKYSARATYEAIQTAADELAGKMAAMNLADGAVVEVHPILL